MNSLRAGIKCQAIRPGYLGGCIMHLTGQKTPETYGRINSWKEDPESSYKLVSGMGAQPGDALAILEVHRRIIRFLLACSRSILHDLPSKSLAPPVSPTGFTCIALLKDQPDAAQPSLLDMIVESPYRVPAQSDFARLHTYVNAKRSESTDHLWLSREDPTYLVEILREASDHQDETVLDDRSDQNSDNALTILPSALPNGPHTPTHLDPCTHLPIQTQRPIPKRSKHIIHAQKLQVCLHEPIIIPTLQHPRQYQAAGAVPHRRRRLHGQPRGPLGPDARGRDEDVDVVGQPAQLVHDFLLRGAEEVDAVVEGDRGAVVCVLDYVGRVEDAVEEGGGGEG
ncbi:MAG: hypothetical protein ASARMPREDX12_003374 [Alectoria sarmentosa]|nr:MAG: hypothetical protein ASARMPREDX12_003374 [Alectoria sarmentosa]